MRTTNIEERIHVNMASPLSSELNDLVESRNEACDVIMSIVEVKRGTYAARYPIRVKPRVDAVLA